MYYHQISYKCLVLYYKFDPWVEPGLRSKTARRSSSTHGLLPIVCVLSSILSAFLGLVCCDGILSKARIKGELIAIEIENPVRWLMNVLQD
jgi:hypothetical protein